VKQCVSVSDVFCLWRCPGNDATTHGALHSQCKYTSELCMIDCVFDMLVSTDISHPTSVRDEYGRVNVLYMLWWETTYTSQLRQCPRDVVTSISRLSPVFTNVTSSGGRHGWSPTFTNLNLCSLYSSITNLYCLLHMGHCVTTRTEETRNWIITGNSPGARAGKKNM
jgi:hypothetical protein